MYMESASEMYKRTLLVATYLVRGRLRPFALFCFAGLSSYPNYLSWSFAILVIQNYYFPPSLLFIFQIYRSSNLIG